MSLSQQRNEMKNKKRTRPPVRKLASPSIEHLLDGKMTDLLFACAEQRAARSSLDPRSPFFICERAQRTSVDRRAPVLVGGFRYLAAWHCKRVHCSQIIASCVVRTHEHCTAQCNVIMFHSFSVFTFER